MTILLLSGLASYLMGSISSAIIVSRLFNLPDPRIHGSNNPGTTNILRLSGKKYAALVLLFDLLKGLLPVLLIKHFSSNPLILGFTGLSAVLGHVYPLFFNFRGGKGVATALGVLLGLHIFLGTLVLITWLVVFLISRYSSLASLIAIALAPVYCFLMTSLTSIIGFTLAITVLIFYKHYSNVLRLIRKTESKTHF